MTDNPSSVEGLDEFDVQICNKKNANAQCEWPSLCLHYMCVFLVGKYSSMGIDKW